MAGIKYGTDFVKIQETVLSESKDQLYYLLRTKKGSEKQLNDLRGSIRRAEQKIRDFKRLEGITNIPDIIIREKAQVIIVTNIVHGPSLEKRLKESVEDANRNLKSILFQEISLAKQKAHYRSILKQSKSRLEFLLAQKQASKERRI